MFSRRFETLPEDFALFDPAFSDRFVTPPVRLGLFFLPLPFYIRRPVVILSLL